MLAYMLHTVLCDSVTSDTSSTTNTNYCSPRWIVHPRLRGYGAVDNRATTPQECLDACVRATNCRTAEWDYSTGFAPSATRCWIHWREPSRQRREHHPIIVQFDIVRACFTTPSTCSHHLLYCRPAEFYCKFSKNYWIHFYKRLI